jgi:hypothetical protein
MKYRNRSTGTIIEAFQLNRMNREDKSYWPVWMIEAWNKEHHEIGAVYTSEPDSDGEDTITVMTEEGPVVVRLCHFIIKDCVDKVYPCRPDIFKDTYEEYFQS